MKPLNSPARALRASLTALAATLLIAAPAAAQEPIRIGAFLSVTGPAAFLGDPEQKTLELYVEKLNAAGGVLGRKLQLVAYDDGGRRREGAHLRQAPDRAGQGRRHRRRLDHRRRRWRWCRWSRQAQMPFISLAGAVVIIEPVKKWVFKTPHTDRMACEKIFVDMRARGIERIALISGPGGFDKSMRGECLEGAPRSTASRSSPTRPTARATPT